MPCPINKPLPDPFYLKGGSTGILLLHGFTGSPSEMSFLGRYLNQAGFTVSCPLLPGHGTYPSNLNRSKWTDWTNHAAMELTNLKKQCRRIFIGGLSMGALLTIFLSARQTDLCGIILYSPATILASKIIYLSPILKYFYKTWPKRAQNKISKQLELNTWGYSAYPVRAGHELLKLIHQSRVNLHRITCPSFIIYCDKDPNIHAKSAIYTYNKLKSIKRLYPIKGNSHCITMDTMRAVVAQKTLEFIRDTNRFNEIQS